MPFKKGNSTEIEEKSNDEVTELLKPYAEVLLKDDKSTATIYSPEIPGLENGQRPSPDEKVAIDGKEMTIKEMMIKRAEAVKKILIEVYKIPESRIKVDVKATTDPGTNIEIKIDKKE